MSETKAAFPATFQRFSMLADGTIRAVIDIDPKDRVVALTILDNPGVSLGVARITNEAAVAHDTKPEAERKPLSLASKVALTCQQISFADFLKDRFLTRWHGAVGMAEEDGQFSTEDACAWFVRTWCQVRSRGEIVEGSRQAQSWRYLEAEYHDWQRRAA